MQKYVIPAKAGIQRGVLCKSTSFRRKPESRGGCFAKVRHSAKPESRGAVHGVAHMHDLTGNPSSGGCANNPYWILCITIGSDVTVVRFGMNRPCTAPLDSGFRRNDGVVHSTRTAGTAALRQLYRQPPSHPPLPHPKRHLPLHTPNHPPLIRS